VKFQAAALEHIKNICQISAMDWNLAVEMNTVALRGVLAMLVALFATAGDDGASAQSTSFPERGGSAPRETLAEKSILSPAPVLPRHLHRFVLRLLRPAESATRRLIIIAARGLVVKVRPFRPRKPAPRKPPLNRRNGYGTGIVIRPGPLPQWARDLMPKRSPPLSLPLLDPLPRYGFRRRNVRPAVAPRIRLLGDPINPLFRRPEPPPPQVPTPDDPLDATRIRYRLDAIARALDDLPGQAERMARWAARRDARLAREQNAGAEGGAADHPPRGEDQQLRRSHTIRITGRAFPSSNLPRHTRLSPMRPGRPPGFRKRSNYDVHAILNELHGLAVYARDNPDTS
jgi:hypothetical protein